MKTALVTGSTRGIGRGIAEALLRDGYAVAVNGRRPEAEVEPVLALMRKIGGPVAYCPGNIAVRSDREEIVWRSIGALGSIGVLVNNAGVAPETRKDVLSLEEDEFDHVMNINLRGTFFLTCAVARHMLEQKNKISSFAPCIITVTSVSAEAASPDRAAYCISKAGLGMLTSVMATRMGLAGIPVYEIRPGVIHSDMTAGVQAKYDAMLEEGLAIEKRWGEPSDVGNAVRVLASGALTYATGQVIYVDGGMRVRRM